MTGVYCLTHHSPTYYTLRCTSQPTTVPRTTRWGASPNLPQSHVQHTGVHLPTYHSPTYNTRRYISQPTTVPRTTHWGISHNLPQSHVQHTGVHLPTYHSPTYDTLDTSPNLPQPRTLTRGSPSSSHMIDSREERLSLWECWLRRLLSTGAEKEGRRRLWNLGWGEGGRGGEEHDVHSYY